MNRNLSEYKDELYLQFQFMTNLLYSALLRAACALTVELVNANNYNSHESDLKPQSSHLLSIRLIGTGLNYMVSLYVQKYLHI